MFSRYFRFIPIVWKYIRKPLIWLMGSVVAVVLMAMVLAYVFEDEVKAFFLQKINAQLNTKVEIGKMDFSLLDHFPHASISLEKVKAHHSKPYTGAGNLLEAQSIDFSFSVLDLFAENYTIKRIDIQNGAINILRNADGIINYELLKPDSSSNNNEKFSFALEKLNITNVNLLIRDDPSRFSTQFLINNGTFSGAFTEDNFDLVMESDLQMNHIRSDKTNWLSDQPMHLDVQLQINKKEQLYRFSEAEIKIADLKLGIDGSIQVKNAPQFDLKISGKDLDVSSFLSLLPEGYDDKIRQYKSDGTFYCNALLKGEWSEEKQPGFSASFGIKDGNILQKENDVELENVNLSGTFTNGSAHALSTSRLELNNVRMVLNGGQVKGQVSIYNFSDPVMNAQADAALSLVDIQKFFPPDPVELRSGKASLHLTLNGKLSQGIHPGENSAEQLQADGLLSINDASFHIKGDSLVYSGFNGNFKFSNNDVTVDNFKGKAGQTDFLMKGHLGNVFGYLFSKDQPINIETTVQSQHVYLDELFGRHSTSSSPDSAYRFRISPRLNLKVNARVDQLQFRKFNAKSIVGDIRVTNRSLIADRLLLKTMGGAVSMSGSVDGTQDSKMLLSCTAKLSKVDISSVFRECENFGQDVMKEENIRGKLDADVLLTAIVSSGLEIDLNKLYSRSDIVITQGELIQFTPLNNLSRFISLDELKHVRFSTLRNQIEIKDRKIIIPRMDIASSAISIGASGVHTFDNVVDYHFELLLSDLLSRKAKKARKENEEFGVVEDDGLGKTRLFISMKGPVDKPEIAYDSKGAQQKIRNDLQTEKKTMKQILHEEFGFYKKDSTVVKEKQTLPDKKKKKVIIEFED